MKSSFMREPNKKYDVISWVKLNLFNSVFNSVLTLLCLYFLWIIASPILNWMIIEAHWSGTAAECQQAEGACWSFVTHNYRFILFGFYPYDQQWRPALGILIFIFTAIFSSNPRTWNTHIIYLWIVSIAVIFILIKGGFFGLQPVDLDNLGGLPLTLMLSVVGILFAYPMGIILALGRVSRLPVIKFICIGYIELIRGVPLISLLFMASVMFPILLPEGLTIDKLFRAQAAIILFAAAYLAETIRGGLQAIPQGQYEAADSLGLGYFQKMKTIILPQAVKTVIPPTVGIFVSTFKDTSLVVIIALFDLLHTAKSSLTNPEWLGFSREAYVFIAVIYFMFCYSMTRYSQWLETKLSPEKESRLITD